MENLEKAFEFIEGEAECISNYEDYHKVMNMLDELKEIFNKAK